MANRQQFREATPLWLRTLGKGLLGGYTPELGINKIGQKLGLYQAGTPTQYLNQTSKVDKGIKNYFANRNASQPTQAANTGATAPMYDQPIGPVNQMDQSAPAPAMAARSLAPSAPTQQAPSLPPIFTEPLQPPTQPQQTYTPDYQYFGGQQFDVSDPTGRLNFFRSRNSALDNERNRQLGDYDTQLRQALAEASQSSARGLSDLESQRGEARQLADKGIYDTNQAYDLGTVNRSNYFAQLSPNAFQSSQGSSQQAANEQRLRGLGDIDSTLQQNYGALDQQRGEIQNAYEDYLTQTQQQGQQYRDELTNYYNDQRDQLRGDFSTYDTQAGIAPRFSADQFAPTQLQKFDLSQYTPYLNFNQLSGSPEANYYRTAPSAKSNLSARDDYLGYNPNKKDKDYIQNYLKRGY